MEKDSTLAWRWRTDHWISVGTQGPVETDFKAGWCEAGGTLEVPYEILFDGECAVSLAGDTNGVALDAVAQTLSIPCDCPRAIRIAAAPVAGSGPLDLAAALDAPGLVWTSAGANRWTPQTALAADGEDAAESGDASGGDSILATTLVGPGTLSWSWRLEAQGTSGIDFMVDADTPCYVESDQAGAWIDESVDIAGDGDHAIQFVFWNEDGAAADRGYVDRVSWTGAAAGGSGQTSTTPEPVPHEWLVEKGLAAEGASAAAFEAAANATARNGRPVWECYVAGLDPARDEDFLARIGFEDGLPRVTWTPSNVAGRVYTVWGKSSLVDDWSSPVRPTHRFFQVRVASDAAGAAAFQSPVTVSFDAAGGTVDPATRSYAAPGALGALPVPEREGGLFLGWWTRETGGVRADGTTAVPWSDWTLHARYLTWTVSGNAVTITGTVGAPTGALTIPAEINGIPVRTIGSNAFKNCSGLTSITIPSSVTSIGGNAFSGCSAIKDVVIPGSFKLSTVFPASYQQITNVVIAQGSTSIVDKAFHFCSGLTSVAIPNGMTSIGNLAFCQCSGLTEITIPDSVTSIGYNAFIRCSGLTSITIPDSVTSIGSLAFDSCSGLTSLTIPDNVTSVGKNAFRYCSNLTTISIPASLAGQTSNWGLPSACRIIVRD